MTPKRVLYSLILITISLQYCISFPITSIPRSNPRGVGVSGAYGTGTYKVGYTTCYGERREEHRIVGKQLDLSFRLTRGFDIHLIHTQFQDSWREIYPDTSEWEQVPTYSLETASLSTFVERTFLDKVRVYAQIHWMGYYSHYKLEGHVNETKSNFIMTLLMNGGISIGKNPEWNFGSGQIYPLLFSVYYRLPQSNQWVLSLHGGISYANSNFIAGGLAWIPK